ncbi:MAG: dephospho-CoA kinase [Wenzhouxiangellaceae bacterium]|nr:dephospho-CoA kinase [Wenzhouxiangellaceae bacterium]
MDHQRPHIVVLTGGIASGKTAVSDAFADLGVQVIDTDRIARELVEPGRPALDAIRERFGDAILDESGALRRARLREIIFSDADARADLEAILHPRIQHEARARIDAASAAYVILVVPLMTETGLFKDADRVLVVDVPEAVQIERLVARDSVSRTQAEAALAAQASRAERLARADEVIENTGTLEQLKARVAALHREWMRESS